MRYAIILALALSACSAQQVQTTTVPASVINDAKTTSYALESTYAASLKVATAWAAQPRCSAVGAPPAPLCSTASGVIKAETGRQVAKSALTRLDQVITMASDASAIDSAIAAAQAAVATYQTVAKGN